ncbi:MAG: hypothetical protein P8L85_09070 [Rubripirellula sp.]|nr:hypothetical protein [Rubripirellula sp.]
MVKQNKIASLLITLFSWTSLGILVGAGGGYVVYVRQPAEFQSVGVIQIAALSGAAAVGDSGTGDLGAGEVEVPAEQNLNGADLITSRAVLSKAASRGRLGRLTGISGRNPEDVALVIQESGKLQVMAGDPGVLGTAYQVQFRGATPRVTQQVVQSVLEATVESLGTVDNSANWSEAVRLLTVVREEIEATLADLKIQLAELPNGGDVVIADGELISSAAIRFKRLSVDAGNLQGLRNALEQKLRNVKAMIQNGASKDAILASLDVPVAPAVVKQAASDPQNRDDAVERERQLAVRLQAEREIMKAMQPLQQEVDSLLKRFGRAHPTVATKLNKIAELQGKLDQLPPLMGENEPPPTSEQQSSQSDSAAKDNSQDQGSDAAKKVLASLRALESEKQQVEQQLEQLVAELDPLAGQVAVQEKNAAARLRLNQAMEAQNELLKQAAVRLTGLPARPSSVQIRAAILRQPGEGIQVAPELQPLLIRGAQIGLVVGLVLVGLLYLTSLASAE